MRSLVTLSLSLAVILTPSAAAGQTAADSARLIATAKDYIEGWYQGDAARMARSLHPELVKSLHTQDTESGRWVVDNQGASGLTNGTARGGGTRTPKDKQRTDVRILDVFQNAAVVRVDADSWVDFLQLVREGERWVILNVLWELRPS